ncbi:hypothetical protein B0H34DRAFT_666573 [Crassisporium funariophilum]|nr:hypothetical protein B0H34DRAFT_666573 [Crassisporium funariophilum]
MSFSGTPLGQGRRLDHSTFLGKPTSSGNSAPASYAYGAPTLGSRSPPKPSSPSRGSQRALEDEVENDEPALARFARLKQRESASELNSRPGGPKVITSPVKPDKWSVKDTSVNIATAFTQAASDMSATYNNSNNSWASTSRANLNVPRSTSVEYETSAPTTINRRLAPPPDRLGRTTNTNAVRKAPSKSASLRHVPDSEGEDEAAALNGRAKSPFDRVYDIAKQALAPATFYARQRSREPDEPSVEQPTTNGNHNGNDSSYDYAAEEQAFQASQGKRLSAAHKRGRMSVDNKAYKPSVSEDEYSSEYSDDGKTRRRRKKGKGGIGGPLTSLPVLSADKRKKKRSSKKKIGGAPDEEESGESDGNTQTEIQSQSAQLRPSVPRSNPPFSRTSAPPIFIDPPHYDPDDSMANAEQGLGTIPEADEALAPPAKPVSRHQSQRARSRTPGPRPLGSTSLSPPFSIGGLLGTVFRLSWQLVKAIITIIVSFFTGIIPAPASFTKYFVLGLTIFGAWYAMRDISSLGSYIPSLSFPSNSPVYRAPEVPAANIAELAERLLRIETALTGLSKDTERTKAKSEDGIRGYSELVGRLGALEGRLVTETKKVLDADARARDTVSKSIYGVKQEVEILQSQIVAQQKQHERDQQQRGGDGTDDEARAKLQALEERVGGIEGGVKEALELGKKAVAAVPAPVQGGPSAAWWNKLTGSKAGLQIRSSDGQDVTSLIAHLVNTAMSTLTKDTIAKPDFALHSGGARVIPALTSPLFEIRPQNLGGQISALLTGTGYYAGRPPVTALHHELQNGHCWPFAGEEGTLGVSLAAPTYVEEVTIDHVAKEVAFDLRSAPRQMEVWGMVEGADNIAKVQAWKQDFAARKEAGQVSGAQDLDEIAYPPTLPKRPEYIRLANFTYDIHSASNVQTFPVEPEIRSLGIDFGIVVLRVLNNWGREEFTCLYRFRVHGQQMGELPAPYSEELS